MLVFIEAQAIVLLVNKCVEMCCGFYTPMIYRVVLEAYFLNYIEFDQLEMDAVIIDLDGTMVDTLGDFCVALNGMLGDLPAPFADAQVDRALVGTMVVKGSENLINSVLSHISRVQAAINLGADALEDDERAFLYSLAWPSYQRHYLAVNGQHAEVYPGVVAGLQYFKARGLKLACLTNKPTAFAVALLKTKNLEGYFSAVFGGDAFERRKPDPLPLLKTCEVLGTVPERTLMIGDSSNDALAARAAGCPVLLVTYGYNHGQPVRSVDADGFMDSMQELVPV